MMSNEEEDLGLLQEVNVRDVWGDEARDFTPWLAQTENMKLLSDTIELELEPPFLTEELIGPFRADIVASEGDGLAIIENQLGPTDHKHLGQLLVYATNREARAVIWISTKVTDEYRKVLDWLNDNTPESILFFGLEVELWRIGDSAPAPRFNVVCKPNELTKLERGRGIAGEPTETKLLQLEFWEAVRDAGKERGSPISFRKPRPQHWYSFAAGRTGFNFAMLARSTFNKGVAVELYMSGKIDAEEAFDQLEQQKGQVEETLGALDWQRLPGKQACRISKSLDAEVDDRDGWPGLIDWCLREGEAFQTTFSPLIAKLDLE